MESKEQFSRLFSDFHMHAHTRAHIHKHTCASTYAHAYMHTGAPLQECWCWYRLTWSSQIREMCQRVPACASLMCQGCAHLRDVL